MTLSSKVQDVLHWVTVIILWLGACIPLVNNLISQHLSGSALTLAVVSTCTAAYNLFNYYAKNTQGTIPPTPPAS